VRLRASSTRYGTWEAVRCRAGAVTSAAFGTVPALRSGMKNAAARPGHGLIMY
jgi:hypothetical protein